jgi:hypothetical protein
MGNLMIWEMSAFGIFLPSGNLYNFNYNFPVLADTLQSLKVKLTLDKDKRLDFQSKKAELLIRFYLSTDFAFQWQSLY